MATYGRILLPVDGSGEAEVRAVVDHAVSLTNATEPSIHLLYVVDETKFTDPAPVLQSDVTDVRTDELLAQYEEAGEAALARTAESIAERDPAVGVVRAVEQGVPHEEIRRYVRAEGIDAVVMATHQRSERDRRLVGSVTERVVRTSDVPVFVVPPASDESEESDGTDATEP